MTLYNSTAGFSEWKGEPVNGLLHPAGIEQSATQAALIALGLYPAAAILSADPLPLGKQATGTVVQLVNGNPKFVNILVDIPVPTIEQRREIIKEQIKAQGLAVRRGGFKWNFGTPESPNVQVLQLRAPTPDNDDEKNWGISLSGYTVMVMLGLGSQPGAKFRTEANQTFTVTYQDGLNILLSMQGWASGLFNVSWAKQEAADAANTHAELDAVLADLPNGWGA
jgi:hypothetical protein